MERLHDEEREQVENLVTGIWFSRGSTQRRYDGVVWVNEELLPSFFFKALKREGADEGFSEEWLLEKAAQFVQDLENYAEHSVLLMAPNGFIFEGGGRFVHLLYEGDGDEADFFLSDELEMILYNDLRECLEKAVLDRVNTLPQ